MSSQLRTEIVHVYLRRHHHLKFTQMTNQQGVSLLSKIYFKYTRLDI